MAEADDVDDTELVTVTVLSVVGLPVLNDEDEELLEDDTELEEDCAAEELLAETVAEVEDDGSALELDELTLEVEGTMLELD